MKKTAIGIILLLPFLALRAQITKSEVKKPVPVQIKTTPPPPPPPTPAPAPAPAPQKTTPKTSEPQQAASVYKLTSARVRIRTGSDNKEFPSNVYVTLRAISDPINWRTYIQTELGNEMKINSTTEFGLNVVGPTLALETFQQNGLLLRMTYNPNFFADAWKIESISVILEFKDQFGNLHPTLGNKTIDFTTAYGFLDNTYRVMTLKTDGSFAPMTSVISKT